MILSSTDKKEIRKFGTVALLFFGFLCIIAVWRQKVVVAYFFGTLSLLGIGFLILPRILKPVYDKWMQIAHFIGKAITVIVLTMMYYLVNAFCFDEKNIWWFSNSTKAEQKCFIILGKPF